ncbi:MAG: aminoglycoside phosphotransferase family protein [Pseudomonadota bacterium]
MACSDVSNVVDELSSRYPEIGVIESRIGGGLSDSFLYQVFAGNRKKVLKLQTAQEEFAFYNKIGPRLIGTPSWLPTVYAMGVIREWNWLLLEYIEHPLPPNRYTFDKEAIGTLRKLHTVEVSPTQVAWVDQEWLPEHIESASGRLPLKTVLQLREVHKLYELIKDENRVLCSGDPNVPNWRVRSNGSIVLLDWQRICFENRAIDLAGWLAKMVSFKDMMTVASIYLSSIDERHVASLARDTAVYFCRRGVLNLWYEKTSAKPELWEKGNKKLAALLPEWIDTLISDMKSSKALSASPF